MTHARPRLQEQCAFHFSQAGCPIHQSGLLKGYILQPVETCCFFHPNTGKPPIASCNVQVHNARILVNPSSVLRGLSLLKGVMYFWAHARTPRTQHRYLSVGNIQPPLPLVALMGLRPYSEGWNLRMSAEAVFVLLHGAVAEEILTDLVDVRPGRVDSVSRASQKLSRRECHLPLSPKPRVTELNSNHGLLNGHWSLHDPEKMWSFPKIKGSWTHFLRVMETLGIHVPHLPYACPRCSLRGPV